LDAQSIVTWKEWKPGTPAAPLIVGCIDYLFPTGSAHHQTRFIYEIDRPTGPNNRSYGPIEFKTGDVPENEMVLAINPALAKPAD